MSVEIGGGVFSRKFSLIDRQLSSASGSWELKSHLFITPEYNLFFTSQWLRGRGGGGGYSFIKGKVPKPSNAKVDRRYWQR